MAYEPPLDELVPAGELVATLAGRTPLEGVNRSEWRGLTCYRFTRPQTPHWDEVRSLSLCVVVQGREVWLCCEGCEAKLRKSPEVYLRKLR